MDVPEHAVCSEAVKLAAKKGFWSLKGFVNAVTRKMAVLIPTLGWSDQHLSIILFRSGFMISCLAGIQKRR